jgi:hypothetical protein
MRLGPLVCDFLYFPFLFYSPIPRFPVLKIAPKPLPKHTLLILIPLQFEVITGSGETPPNLLWSFTEID